MTTTEGAEIVKLVHDAKPAVPQCPHCKYFVPGTAKDPGGRCRITMHSVAAERQDYTEDQSCGPEAKWFRAREEDVEPVTTWEPEPESAPEKPRRRISLSFGLLMFIAGVLSAVFVLGGLE